MDILLLLYETLGLFGVSVTWKNNLSDVAVLPGLIPNDAQTSDRHLCHHLHWLSRSAVFTCLPGCVVHGCTGLLFESFIYNLDWPLLSEQHWDQFEWTFENTDHFPVDHFRLVSTLLAESLRSFDLSRKIEGDSVRRVFDQILGSYLLSCMAFSVLIRSRLHDLSVTKLVYLRFSWGVNKVTTRQTSHANDFVNKNTKSHAREKLLLAGYWRLALPSIGIVIL